MTKNSKAEDLVIFHLLTKPKLQGFLDWMDSVGVSDEEQDMVCAMILKYEPGLKLADEAPAEVCPAAASTTWV